MPPIRFAILAAVSTKKQAAADKISIENQIERCRGAGMARGWQESAGPYIIPGASRSFYFDLSAAAQEIPAIREMWADAKANRYDVLMVYTYDRLGDLTNLVAMALRLESKQLYSLTQAVEPQPPDQYDPYNAEAEATMRDVAQITQRFRIDDLRRKYRAGIPARVKKGLAPLLLPYGYTWTGKQTPAKRDPLKSAVVLRIRDEFMAGKTMGTIASGLNADGIPTPRGHSSWRSKYIKYVLINPFYAGLVALGKNVHVHDERRKHHTRPIPQPYSSWEIAPGLHEALWDVAAHQAILAEMQIRDEQHKKFKARYPLSGLLICGVCRGPVHRIFHGIRSRRRILLACEKTCTHARLDYADGLNLISSELAGAIFSRSLDPLPPSQTGPSAGNERALAELANRRKRVQEGYESGLYTQIEAAEKLSAIKKQIEDLETRQRQNNCSIKAWEDWQTLLIDQPVLLEHFPEWVRAEKPALVNRLLAAIVKEIVINHDQSIEIVWRQ